MKVPKSYLDNLTAAKYKDYLKLLPSVEKENTRLYVTLVLTLVALSFFGIFAINPTLTTIFELRKEVEEKQLVADQLTRKISNLSNLQQEFNGMETQLFVLYDAIPKTPSAPLLSAQIEALAKKNKLSIISYRVAEVQVASDVPSSSKTSSFIFTLQASGNYQDMMNFSTTLAKIDRVITVESMSIGRDSKTNDLQLNLRGRQYFKL